MADRRFAYCCTYFSVSFSYKCYFYFYFYFYGNKKSPSPGDEWVKKERERRAHVVSYHLEVDEGAMADKVNETPHWMECYVPHTVHWWGWLEPWAVRCRRCGVELKKQ